MKTLHFQIEIAAPENKVYQTMLEPKGYSDWTSVFSGTSRFKGDWSEGSKMLFLGDDKEGNVCGMVSMIRANKPNEFVSIEHIGSFENNEEVTSGENVDAFSGALEEYTFEGSSSGTSLKVRMDVISEWEAYFNETWPKALEKLKSICEE